MPYDVRDLLGHFVKPKNRAGEMCPHPCCKGRRPHPERLPVMLSGRTLRALSETELVAQIGREKVQDNPDAYRKVLRELERREDKQKADRHRRRSKQESYRLWLEREWEQAESDTRGSMVNKRGRAKGIDPRSLWTAPPNVRNAYASEELKSYWDRHPRLTAADFAAYEARDEARVNAQNKARRGRALYGVY